MGQRSSANGRFHRNLGRFAAAAGTVALAGITAFVVGLASNASDSVTATHDKFVTASFTEDAAGCGAGLYTPESTAKSVRATRPAPDMDRIQRMPGAAFVESDAVTVSIQGTSAREITLTGISFQVTKVPPPTRGATFSLQCGGPTMGRTVVASLDSDPPRIVESNALADVPLGDVEGGKSMTRPIEFPWTVSITDPLLLHVIATTKSCDCRWTATIPWVSGSARGVIHVDDHGKPFRVTADPHLRLYVDMNGRWTDASTL